MLQRNADRALVLGIRWRSGRPLTRGVGQQCEHDGTLHAFSGRPFRTFKVIKGAWISILIEATAYAIYRCAFDDIIARWTFCDGHDSSKSPNKGDAAEPAPCWFVVSVSVTAGLLVSAFDGKSRNGTGQQFAFIAFASIRAGRSCSASFLPRCMIMAARQSFAH
jgi:hypothetical protein